MVADTGPSDEALDEEVAAALAADAADVEQDLSISELVEAMAGGPAAGEEVEDGEGSGERHEPRSTMEAAMSTIRPPLRRSVLLQAERPVVHVEIPESVYAADDEYSSAQGAPSPHTPPDMFTAAIEHVKNMVGVGAAARSPPVSQNNSGGTPNLSRRPTLSGSSISAAMGADGRRSLSPSAAEASPKPLFSPSEGRRRATTFGSLSPDQADGMADMPRAKLLRSDSKARAPWMPRSSTSGPSLRGEAAG